MKLKAWKKKKKIKKRWLWKHSGNQSWHVGMTLKVTAAYQGAISGNYPSVSVFFLSSWLALLSAKHLIGRWWAGFMNTLLWYGLSTLSLATDWDIPRRAQGEERIDLALCVFVFLFFFSLLLVNSFTVISSAAVLKLDLCHWRQTGQDALCSFWFASKREVQIELNEIKVCRSASVWRSSWDWVSLQHLQLKIWVILLRWSEEQLDFQTHRSERFLYFRCVQGWTSPTSCSETQTKSPFLTAASRGISRLMMWVLRWSTLSHPQIRWISFEKKKMINLSAECDLFSQRGPRVTELDLRGHRSSFAHLQFHCALLHDWDKWALCKGSCPRSCVGIWLSD